MKRDWKNRHVLKGLLIFEILIFYIVVLFAVYQVHGPAKYAVNWDKPLAEVSDFASMQDGEMTQGPALHVYNPTSGNAVGYSAQLSLEAVEQVYIELVINCPEDFAGKVLYIDLYDYETGYDDEAQQYNLVLQAGINEVSCVLAPGENAPRTCEVRFFTSDLADYYIENVQLFERISQNELPPAMVGILLICAALIAITALLFYKVKCMYKR